MCELCRELGGLPGLDPVPEPELVCHERERERRPNALLMRASEAALPLWERGLSRDTRGLEWDEDGESRPTESSRSRTSMEPSGEGWSERDARSSSRSEPEPMLPERCGR